MSDRLAPIMKVYIPTLSRETQKTADALNVAGVPFVLVTDKPIEGYPYTLCSAKGIASTRQWILEKAEGKFIMMDDDLRFHARDPDGKTFHKASPTELKAMCLWIEELLDTYAHGGVTPKFMSQATPRGHVVNGRYYHILAYNKNLFPIPYPRFRMAVGEEADVQLQLLIRGFSNFVLTEFANDDISHAPGGCSVWRTLKLEYDVFRTIEKMYPGLFKVVEKGPGINPQMIMRTKKAGSLGIRRFPRLPLRFPRLRKTVVLAIVGCNGSGKSTLFKKVRAHHESNPRIQFVGTRGRIMGGTDGMSLKDFWKAMDQAIHLNCDVIIMEGQKWGHGDSLRSLEKFCDQNNCELWLGLVDNVSVEECFKRVNSREGKYRISLPNLTRQRDRILRAVSQFPRTTNLETRKNVDKWLRRSNASI